jgi:hypothetical protein
MKGRTKPPHHKSASIRGELLLIAVCVVTLALAQFSQVVLHDQYDNDLKDSSVYEIRPDPLSSQPKRPITS